MKTRTENINAMDVEITQYEGPYALVVLYKLLNSKIFDTIDVWVLKDHLTNKPTAIKIGANFKSDFDIKNINKFLLQFGQETRSLFQEMNFTHLDFVQHGREIAKAKARDFIKALCKIDNGKVDSFNFMLDISLLNDATKAQEEKLEHTNSSFQQTYKR